MPGGAVFPRHGPESLLGHDQHENKRQHKDERAADQYGETQLDTGECHTHTYAGKEADAPGLAVAQVHLGQMLLSHLVGDPGIQRTADESITDATYDRRQQDQREARKAALDHPTGTNQHLANDDREAAAVGVGDYAGGYLAEQDRGLKRGANQHKLERIHPDLLHVVHGQNRVDHAGADRVGQPRNR